MITIVERIPDANDSMRLRAVTGMQPRSKVAAERGLPKSLFAIVVLDGEMAIGMGRVVGDGYRRLLRACPQVLRSIRL